MKRIIKPIFVLSALFVSAVSIFVSSCEDDNKGVVLENKKPSAPSGQVKDITFYTADITGKLELSKNELNQSEFGLLLSKTEDVMAVNSDKYPIKNFDKDYGFTLSLSGLDSVTTYYYRSYIYYEGNYIYSDVQSFTTRSPLDVIKTGLLSSDSCTVISRIDSKNLIDYIQTYGICYGTTLAPSLKDQFVTTDSIGDENKFNLKLYDIPFDTLVNYRAFVRVNNIDFFGPTLHFQGNTVRTGSINITDYTVTSHLKINDGYKELGVCYGMDSIPSILNQKVNTTTVDNNNDFKLKLVNIPFDTIVYYRAYALTEDSVYYGGINSFGGNSVTTGIIDTVTFQVQSTLKYNDDFIEFGVCYSNSDHPTVYDKKVYIQELDTTGCYTLNLKDIPFGAVYYRSYVIKDRIAYYGDVRKFEGNSITTGDFNYESLTTKSIIKFSNSYSYSEIGICYGNNPVPTTTDKRIAKLVTDTICNYELFLSNIPFGIVYYRAYMFVDGSPIYGEVKQIEGNSIITGSFDESTLIANSSIKYSIGYDALNLGICYSNSENPTINDKKVTTTSVDSLNSFGLQLTEVPFGKVYYRSYMMYEGVPQYGTVKNFEGNEITTGDCDTTTYQASASLKIIKGYETLDLGICYSNTQEPTINDLKVSTNKLDSSNIYTVQFTSIPFGTVYYRSYMMLNGMPHYGEVKSCIGNDLITGDYDQQSLSVKSHVRIKDVYSELTYGICYGEIESPSIENKTISTKEIDSNNDFKLILKNNPVGSKVYYRSYVEWNGKLYYGEIRDFIKQLTVEMVDLGLSVKWASFNVGADYPEDFGDYYAWGEIETKTSYEWTNYRFWSSGDSWGNNDSKLNKYIEKENRGVVDNKTTLDIEDDVANVKWGGDWRIPTREEMNELLKNCTLTKTTVNEIVGFKVESNIPGHENKSIFLPAAGYWINSFQDQYVGNGYYWTSSLGKADSEEACHVFLGRDLKMLSDIYRVGIVRSMGLSVRPVCP